MKNKNEVILRGKIFKKSTVFELKQTDTSGATVHIMLVDDNGDKTFDIYHDAVTFDKKLVDKAKTLDVNDEVELTGSLIQRARKIGIRDNDTGKVIMQKVRMPQVLLTGISKA